MNGEMRKELLLVDHENYVGFETRNKQCMASGSIGIYFLWHVRVSVLVSDPTKRSRSVGCCSREIGAKALQDDITCL